MAAVVVRRWPASTTSTERFQSSCFSKLTLIIEGIGTTGRHLGARYVGRKKSLSIIQIVLNIPTAIPVYDIYIYVHQR
jgi:hypothetical protein